MNAKHLAAIRFQFITQASAHYGHEQSAAFALEGGCRWIQLRCKDISLSEVRRLAIRIKALCRRHEAVFILNDYAELAFEVGADGVHLGQDDMPVEAAVGKWGKKLITGYSCHSFAEILSAFQAGADYAGVGAFRATPTKQNLSALLGLEGYRTMVGQCRKDHISLPLIAIGGIQKEDLTDLLDCGMDGIAVSSAALKSEFPAQTVGQMLQIMNDWQKRKKE
jgi:thiamine-phosphate pyrophosphorylase